MKTARKVLLVVLCAALLVGASVAGTLAYLSKTTEKITNTFTIGNIDLTLTETKPDGKSAKLIPGTTIDKDPKVTVTANSEKCYVFVKVEESAPNGKTFADYIKYEIADGWTALTGNDGVYYRVVDASTTNQEFAVLKNNQVSIPDSVEKENVDDLTGNFTLSFTAYAIQSEGFATAAAAWAKFDTAD